MSELKNWISFTQRRYIEDDVDRQWKQHNPGNVEELPWEVSYTQYLHIEREILASHNFNTMRQMGI